MTYTAGGTGPLMAIFANRAATRQEMREDAEQAGFTIGESASLARLLEEDQRLTAEVVLVDCPEVLERGADALARLDAHAARTGTRLIVSTSFAALDAVYAACAASDPQILVNATRAGRVIALGLILAEDAGPAVRELSDHDRLLLLRLTEQVGTIAQRLDGLGAGAGGGGGAASAPVTGSDKALAEREGAAGHRARQDPPPLPDPRLVRRIIQHRQARARFLQGDLFADPAWDMLLDLTAAHAEDTRVSVTSLCIAAGVPPTTALRWIGQMTKVGLLERIEDAADKRRVFIAMSEQATEAMARYFDEIGAPPVPLV